MLAPEQRRFFEENGYLLLPSHLSLRSVAAVRATLDRLIEQAAGLETSNAVYDLEESHRPERPRVRRIKLPHLVDPVFDRLLRSEEILAPVRDLLGPNLRLHTTKLNLKSAEYGAAVEWHQDWTFYPHSNDDMLAVGVVLDDVDTENGPLMVFPGSHRGPVFDHHSGGYFAGAMSLDDAGLDAAAAVRLTGPAGSISLHHVRTVHGSDLNRSDRDRALLLFEIAAADAWPLAGTFSKMDSLEAFDQRMLCGQPTVAPRLRDVPVRIPLPKPPDAGSIYEVQRQSAQRTFATVAAG